MMNLQTSVIIETHPLQTFSYGRVQNLWDGGNNFNMRPDHFMSINKKRWKVAAR